MINYIYSFTKKIRKLLFNKRRKQWIKHLNKKINNKEFSIISSNCFGGHIYQLLNLEYKTPTVGLFFYAPCYINFIKNINFYTQNEIKFITKSKYEEANTFILKNKKYPIGQIKDIEIHFLHYEDEHEALFKWNKRVKRINYNNIFFTMTDRDLCTENEIRQFNALPHKNKIIFTSKDYRDKYASSVWLKKYENEPHVGVITNPKTGEKEVRKYFDIAKWLNNNFN